MTIEGSSDERHLALLREATLRGTDAVLRAAAAVLGRLSGSDYAVIVENVGDSWQNALKDDLPVEAAGVIEKLPAGSREWDTRREIPDLGMTFVPLRAGALAAIVPKLLDPRSEIATTTSIAAEMCDILVRDAERIENLRFLIDEVSDGPIVPLEILSMREIDQLLLSSVNAALQIVEADMAGVFLLEEGELVMRSCVGHRTAQTAHLRMHKGQGLAGQVLATGRPCAIDDYFASAVITHEFDTLAEKEGAFAALAAPLAIGGDIIGVLEVWARRRSVFVESHERRIVEVAKFVSIAINNAREFERQQEDVRELSEARFTLQGRLSAIQGARSFQQTLGQLLLEGAGLAAIIRLASTELGATTVVLSNEFDVIDAYPPIEQGYEVRDEVAALVKMKDPKPAELNFRKVGEKWAVLQRISAGDDQLGWLYVTMDYAPDMAVELAIGEAFLHIALCQVMERTADYVRSSEREEILWDLIEGSTASRLMAVDRSRWLRPQLAQPQRLLRGRLWDPEVEPAGATGELVRSGRVRHRLLARLRDFMVAEGAGELVALRGNELAAIVPFTLLPKVRRIVDDITAIVCDFIPDVEPVWGVSGVCERPLSLDRASREASTALRAAEKLKAGTVASYDELGVVRLFVAAQGDDSIREFVRQMLGDIIEYDERKDGRLLETLRVYFEANCSQQDAADKLFIHHKTVRYRLTRIEELSGLDLSRHEDRINLDLALKVHSVMNVLAASV
ncbi:MAG: helix-turn-helix domain-containing protein [bacterium]|nr:helix-turn-helix domain-containing protein [bacterium]MCY3952372.1 helix-turn-helix domain-containing protein [bacterium]MCY4102394.1 helix-turn-helix domain-containing protein [bacterium]